MTKMSEQKVSFMQYFYENIIWKVYGLGASVVILGAMFKLLNLPFSDVMLAIGLSTEVIIFALSAFEPRAKDVDWTKVYPELADETGGPYGKTKRVEEGSVSKQLDHMLESANIGPELVESLGKGMKNMAESASNITSLANASVATEEYAQNVKSASNSLIEMNKSYKTTMNAMEEMSTASQDAREYHAQVQNVTKNLSALNAVYEMELQDAESHVKAMNKFYNNVSSAMESMLQAAKDTESFKMELSKLTTNLSSLNRIYGNMLTAMKSQE